MIEKYYANEVWRAKIKCCEQGAIKCTSLHLFLRDTELTHTSLNFKDNAYNVFQLFNTISYVLDGFGAIFPWQSTALYKFTNRWLRVPIGKFKSAGYNYLDICNGRQIKKQVVWNIELYLVVYGTCNVFCHKRLSTFLYQVCFYDPVL